jgi:predicted aspartyl protease
MQKAGPGGRRTGFIGLALMVWTGHPVLADTPVRFRTIMDRLVVVPVHINGQGPFDFLLDTGTSTTVVDLELARQLDVRPVDRLSLVGPGGATVVPRAILKSLSLGPRSAEDVETVCADLRSIQGLDRSIRGFLGQAFLSRFNYLLSYKDRRLEFLDPVAPSEWRGTMLAFEDDEGRIVVSAEPSSAGRPRRFVLDSGASEPVLFERADGLGPDIDENGDRVAALTSKGSREMRTVRVRRLAVGDERFHDLRMLVVTDADGPGSRSEDGLLPTSLFRAVYFNNSEGFVLLNPHR